MIYALGIIVASDKASRAERDDESGVLISSLLEKHCFQTREYAIVPDDRALLAEEMIRMCDVSNVDLLLTTGGTGFAPRDVTPEATLDVCERLCPGIPEAMRAASLAITPRAMLTRAAAGIRGRTLIVNLPGSPKAVRECIDVIMASLPHGLSILRGDASECARK